MHLRVTHRLIDGAMLAKDERDIHQHAMNCAMETFIILRGDLTKRLALVHNVSCQGPRIRVRSGQMKNRLPKSG